MSDIFESHSFLLPSQVQNDVEGRFKAASVKSVELHLKGDSLADAEDFGRLLMGLKKRGVKISHEFTIRLEFPRSISRETAVDLVGRMPRSRNGLLKVRIETSRGRRKGAS